MNTQSHFAPMKPQADMQADRPLPLVCLMSLGAVGLVLALAGAVAQRNAVVRELNVTEQERDVAMDYICAQRSNAPSSTLSTPRSQP